MRVRDIGAGKATGPVRGGRRTGRRPGDSVDIAGKRPVSQDRQLIRAGCSPIGRSTTAYRRGRCPQAVGRWPALPGDAGPEVRATTRRRRQLPGTAPARPHGDQLARTAAQFAPEAMFNAMAITVVILWLGTLTVALLLFRADIADRASAWRCVAASSWRRPGPPSDS